MDADLLSRLNAARAGRQIAWVITPLAGDDPRQRLVVGDIDTADPLAPLLERARRSGKSFADEEAGVFVGTYVPPTRLVVLGAVHISQALAPMAHALGHDVTIVDPRTAFASAERFPGMRLIAEWPDAVLPRLGLDPWTAFAALTHDPKIDDVGLRMALDAQCFYVGALGSRRTHAKRLQRLTQAGVAADALAAIKAPIGLAIGAASPAEIAVSILAEITSQLRGGAVTAEGMSTPMARDGVRREDMPA